MGVVFPPWVDKDFFESAPFNFCDHFGDRKELAKVCRICRDAVKEGWGKFDLEEIFDEAAKNVTQTDTFKKRVEMALPFYKKIDLDIEDLAEGYSVLVRAAINDTLRLPKKINKKVKYMAFDILVHSEHYVVVKIKRAISSEERERKHPILKDSSDSKTSALFAYMAVDRNARAAHKLATLNIIPSVKEKFNKFSKSSVNMSKLIKKEFFPEYDFELQEFGADSYNKIFKPFIR